MKQTKYPKKSAAPSGYRFLWLVILCLCGFFAFKTTSALHTISYQAGRLQGAPVTVVLDAGHGGEDGGAVAQDGTQEKDINLAIALKLRPLLESSGIRVVMIRDQDVSVGDSDLETVKERKRSDLQNRLQLLKEEGEESILLSIHQNHFSQSQYYGTQIFYSPNNPQSAVVAESIQNSVVKSLQPENERSCKEAGNSIYLLWNTHSPAVIVECGFLSNQSESKKLQDPAYQTQMAFSIWLGFLDYLEQQENGGEDLVMLPVD